MTPERPIVQAGLRDRQFHVVEHGVDAVVDLEGEGNAGSCGVLLVVASRL
jgi:hypothetical protein